MSMRVLLVAPPGAGKGTQAEKLAFHYGVVHLSSGDLLRQQVKAGTVLGKAASEYLRRGDLVPDDLIFDMMMGPVLDASRHGGYVLDGFPRNLRQAEAAYQTAQQDERIELQAVIQLDVSREELTRRLVARALREGRSDDTESVIEHRFEVYATETEPLLAFYRGRGLVVTINGEQDEEQVFADIVRSFTIRGDATDGELLIADNHPEGAEDAKLKARRS
jgi:adenylate kinase